ncbi:hypothetical protein [Rubrivirga sp. IMCC43871]|uniref:hypothetical protein n=1 Tax=Rubrivirga sp. IMCC43871 TaxID=3391575 RepID=UPI00399034DE
MLRSVLVLALAVAVLGGCARRGGNALPPGVELNDLPDSESWDAALRTSRDGAPLLEVSAPYLARYTRDSAYVYLGPVPGDTARGGVSIQLYASGDAPGGAVRSREAWLWEDPVRVVAEGGVRADVDGAQVQAPRIEIDADGAFRASGGASVELAEARASVRAQRVSGAGGRYEASGAVRVLTSGGRTLEAGRVIYDQGSGRFSAPGAFAFDGPGERVRGVGLSATADLSRYSFRRATGQIEVRE